MITRREMLQVSAATAALTIGAGGFTRVFAQQKLTQDELTKFDSLGNVTLLHITDIHGQLMPVYFREPSVNLGVGANKGLPPHITGTDFLKHFGIAPKSAAAYAMTDQDFTALAGSYGRIGGLDRLATVVAQVRAERDGKVLLLDGGDTWQGSLGANASKGQDMADCMELLKPDAMTGHWEFTYGARAGQGADQGARLPVPGAQCSRHRMERAGVRRLQDVREGRRQDRGARAGFPLYAGRQSALDDAEMVVRYS